MASERTVRRQDMAIVVGVHDGNETSMVERTIFVAVLADLPVATTPTPSPEPTQVPATATPTKTPAPTPTSTSQPVPVPITTQVPTPTPTPTATPTQKVSGASGPTLNPTPVPTPTFTPQVPGVTTGQQDETVAQIQELKQLVQDIKEEMGKLQQELEPQSKYPVLGVSGLKGYAYPYQGIPDTFTFQKNLQYGMYDQEITYLQIALNADPSTQVAYQGYGSPKNETNYFGLKTWNAVCSLQEKYSMEILGAWNLAECTGYVGTTTRTKLNQLLEEARETRNKLVPQIPGGTISQAQQTLLQSLEEAAGEGLEAVDQLGNALIPYPYIGGALKAPKSAALFLSEAKGALKLATTTLKTAKQAQHWVPTNQELSVLQRGIQTLRNIAILTPYVVKYGDTVLEYTKKYGDEGLAFVDKMVERFPNTKFQVSSEGLAHVWENNPVRAEQLKKAFRITKKEELSVKLEEISRTGRKGIYKQYNAETGTFEGDRFGFLDESRGVFTAWDETGQFVTAFPGDAKYFTGRQFFFELR